MARLHTGTVLRIWRAFGRVRFTTAWGTGETNTITVPKRQWDASVRVGDTIGTIMPDPPYTAEDLLRWNARDAAMEPSPVLSPSIDPDTPPEARYYHRVGGRARS